MFKKLHKNYGMGKLQARNLTPPDPKNSWMDHYYLTKHYENVPKSIVLHSDAWHTVITTHDVLHFTSMQEFWVNIPATIANSQICTGLSDIKISVGV